jgi:hypothetical protein
MPVGEANLPVHMAAAEQATMQRSIAQMQERAVNQAAAARSEDQGREDVSDLVKGMEEVEGATIQGESRGAHSYTLKKEEEEEEKPAPVEEKPSDPEGRGKNLDIQG